jgi:peptidoglycan/LPS O-acetylase OafA/YrhL
MRVAAKSTNMERSDYLPALTGVRAIAAFLVLFLHANQVFPTEFVGGLAFVHRGYLGVDLFFMLSGFIIAHVYLRVVAGGLPYFLWHRVIRLWPAHAAVLAALVGLVVAARRAGFQFNEPGAWELAALPAHFLMVHAWGFVDVAGWNAPSWSVSAEWFAYLSFPLVAWGLLRIRPAAACVLAAGSLLAMALVFALAGWNLKSALLGLPALTRVLGEFVCGACIYRVVADLRFRVGWIAPCAVAAFIAGAALQAPDIVLVLTFAPLLVGAYAAGSVALRSLAAIEWFGEISYSLYLVHFPLFIVFRRAVDALPNAAAFPAALALATAAATVLYYSVERPVRRRLRGLVEAPRPRAAP